MSMAGEGVQSPRPLPTKRVRTPLEPPPPAFPPPLELLLNNDLPEIRAEAYAQLAQELHAEGKLAEAAQAEDQAVRAEHEYEDAKRCVQKNQHCVQRTTDVAELEVANAAADADVAKAKVVNAAADTGEATVTSVVKMWQKRRERSNELILERRFQQL